ncbi:MAG TPA: DUF3320 domain-containing protein, partial [Planctomycetota bacterium]|nr:DUF3320 domain-containing protein [Planctomycetota bacterium]
MADRVGAKLEDWKRRLIDLSRRNRLLHYRLSQVTSVRVVEERPAELFRLAAIQGASLSFLPWVEAAAPETKVHVPGEAPEARHLDRALQTDLGPDRLAENLLAIHRKSVSILEEHGHNTLFLALGFLDWYEESAREDLIHSPLVLVPADLVRTSVRGQFRLRPREDEPMVNPALLQRLRTGFGIELPSLPDDLEGFDPVAFYAAVAKAIEPLKRAYLMDGVVLGLFSFAKFFMFKDLEVHAEAFGARPLVRLLAGDASAADALPRDPVPKAEELDALGPETSYQVLDADSSQQEAIEAVKRGRSLVIEGPPGTGKSQTIANIVAECLVAGKSVLFVSEKMAALRVVQDRLQRAGLGDFGLELHSHKARKGPVLAELARVLDLPRDLSEIPEGLLDHLARARDRLNSYVRDLGDPVLPLGMAPFEAYGRLAAMESLPELPVFLKGAASWTRPRFEAARDRIRALAEAHRGVHPADRHPWRGCALEVVSYETRLALQAAVGDLLKTLPELERAAADLAGKLETRAPATLEEARDLDDIARLLAESPRPARLLLEGPLWDRPRPDLDVLLAKGAAFSMACGNLRKRYRDELLDADVESMHAWWQEHGSSLSRFLRPSFWKWSGLLKRLRVPGATGRIAEDIELAAVARRLRSELAAADGSAFGIRWKGPESDWEDLASVGRWLADFRRHARSGLASPKVLAIAEAGAPAPPRIAAPLAEVGRAHLHLAELARVGLPARFEQLRKRVEEMRDAPGRLEEWARWMRARREASESDAGPAVEALGGVAEEFFEPLFEKQFLRSWLEEVVATKPSLAGFGGSEQDRLVAEFRELDRRTIEANRIRARNALVKRLPDAAWPAGPGSDLGILQREVRKKRGHLPLRKIFASVPRALRRLKPCLLMSPLSVAQFLDPSAEPFDVVIFDEASQVAPEDGVGAVARGSQLVIVGDARQLPPTSFFQVEPSDDVEPGGEVEGSLESILDEGASVFPDRRLLRWHYRSRNEELIAFSNRVYYGNRLCTFPSASAGVGARGIEFIHLPAGVYDRGGSGTNRVEAGAVAAAVFDHLKRHPDKSVGVGAFSIRQQQAIEDELEKLRAADSSLEDRFDAARDEYCFVKNLETIQGDERDVVFLSVSYGKDATGRMTSNFGPLNLEGGARRLNVLVTRAREKVVVFSSVLPEEIELAESASEGARNLRSYLEYARGGAEKEASKGAAPSTDIERVLHAALAARGLRVSSRVGRSEYRVDLAVEEGGRYLLGIECDGPPYRSAATARDRDRLREEVLAKLGWRLHRVWSPDLLRQAGREVERILDALERARVGAPEERIEVKAGVPAAPAVTTGREPGGVRAYRLFPVRRRGLPDDFHAQPVAKLADLAAEIVECEGPVHEEVLARRVADHWGIARMGPRVSEIVEAAVAACERSGDAVRRGPFVWPAGLDDPAVRSREDGGAPREGEHIAPEEVEAAVLLVLGKELRV